MIRRFHRKTATLGQDKVEAMDQENRRRELYALLGDLPDRDRRISARTISETQSDGYTVERLVLDLNGIEPVPAVFVRPAGHTGPFPCVLYHHAHGANYGLGKEELLEGRPELYRPPYAVELTRHGIAALCLDAWLFGERRGRTESELFKEMLWHGPSLLKHFTTADIVSLIAPRPHLGLAGNHDRLTPAKGLDRIDTAVSRVYQELGSPEKWQLLRYEIGHFETAQMRAEVVSFLQHWL